MIDGLVNINKLYSVFHIKPSNMNDMASRKMTFQNYKFVEPKQKHNFSLFDTSLNIEKEVNFFPTVQ